MAFDAEKLLEKEWLITNKRGAYSMLGATGALHSRTHSLLACKTDGAKQSFSILSKIDETIEIDGDATPLSTNCYSLDTVHPTGYTNISKINLDGSFSITHKIENTVITKSIYLDEFENLVMIKYDIDAEAKGNFEISPLLNPRYVDDIYRKEEIEWEMKRKDADGGQLLSFTNTDLKLLMTSEKAKYEEMDRWYYYFRYDKDIEMGIRGREDLYNPGVFTFEIPRKGKYSFTVNFIAHTESSEIKRLAEKTSETPEEITDHRKKHEKEILDNYFSECAKSVAMESVVRASDAFVQKNAAGTYLATGYYPDSKDDFRKVMMSIPGILLSTKRYEEAKSLLSASAKLIKEGVAPRYMDGSGFTADNGFWFCYALYMYAEETNDKELVQELMPAVVAIGDAYLNGYGDRVMIDKFMMVETTGEGSALTWMDAEVEGSATTPRVGKPVEVNALWYNYLKFGEYFDSLLGVKSELFKKKQKFTFKQISRKVGSRFGREFWNRRDDYLYDYVSGDEKMEIHRGNQAIVLGLPFSVLEVAREKKLMKLLEKEMITEVGIRSIHPTSAQFVETLPNDQEGRAIAYYQGTIWPFLVEFYVRGGLRLLGNSARVRDRLKKGSENLYSHVNDRIPGFLPELYTSIHEDGEAVYIAEGKHAFALSSAAAMSIYQLLH